MKETSKSGESNPRRPALAVLLSLAAAGVGHIYCGRPVKGFVLFFASFVFAPVIVAVANLPASNAWLIMILGSLGLMGAIYIYAMMDAFLLARKTGREYRLKDYNRWYVYLLLIAVSVGFPSNLAASIRDDVLQAFRIPSKSMAPGVLPGDYVLANKAVYKTRSPERGDVVIFINPNERHLNYVKRIAAMPGDTVEIRANVLLINDRPLEGESIDLPPLNFEPEPEQRALLETNGGVSYPILVSLSGNRDFPRTTVPNGHCFVLGDNRSESLDSRNFGPVPLVDILGRLEYIYWPALTWSRFGNYPYHELNNQ